MKRNKSTKLSPLPNLARCIIFHEASAIVKRSASTLKARLVFALTMSLAMLLNAASMNFTMHIPDAGWRLWPDTNGAWKNDVIYLPDEVKLNKLPVNPPTGGWGMLNDRQGISVLLPSTVEAHYWGKFGLRHYTDDEYFYAKKGDQQPLNGSYDGVSWWWQNVAVPASYTNKVILLHIRGARQRAEVYVNHRLVGYNIIAETSFSCDISRAVRPGETNQIAIRITNPGGRFDWLDTRTMKWGKVSFQASHGFGGLDRDITMTAEDAVYLSDAWVLNTPKIHEITALAAVTNTTDQTQRGILDFCVMDPQSRTVLTNGRVPVSLSAHASRDVASTLSCPQAQLWNLDSPRLYQMQARLEISGEPAMHDEFDRQFGFRWFEPRGVGERAGLYLNEQRIRLYTAISWGFWGINGLWPTPLLAEKEVRDAKELGLNMLNFHRNIGKEEVLAEQDKLGLLRYMEAGGGVTTLGRTVGRDTPAPSGQVDTSGTGGEAKTFAEKYEETKILRMIRQFRSHPSLVIYVIQNETEPDLRDPRVFNLLRAMHELDPSRVIAAKSGISYRHQVWFAPYEKAPCHDDGAGYSGWHDKHTVGGPGVWIDDLYKNPTNFTHRIVAPREIVDWGEMLGAAVADNHPLMVRQILADGGSSYDLADHEELAQVYDEFLDRWGFRQAFPTDQKFYTDLGNKCYSFWGKVLETARLCEDNDILTVSGWESTAIENHSGLVDNLRNFKGNPELIAAKLAPLLPVVKPRHTVCSVGEKPVLDIYLVNETGRAAEGKLDLTIVDPLGKSSHLAQFTVPAYEKSRFVYPVKFGIAGPALEQPGKYQFELALSGGIKAQNSEEVLVVDPQPGKPPTANIGVIGSMNLLAKQWAKSPQVRLERYRTEGKYDLVIASPESAEDILPETLIQKVRAGMQLLVFTGSTNASEQLARQLASAGAFRYDGIIPHARASWMGDWVFVRSHPLYAGLPVNEVMKGDYQIPVLDCFGLRVDGPGVAIVAGYGRDHDRDLGAATFTANLGKGKVVFQTLTKMCPVMETRWLNNALMYLAQGRMNQ